MLPNRSALTKLEEDIGKLLVNSFGYLRQERIIVYKDGVLPKNIIPQSAGMLRQLFPEIDTSQINSPKTLFLLVY